MSTAWKFVVRQLRITGAIGLLTFVPFVSNFHAAAASMDGDMQTVKTCASYCVQQQIFASQQENLPAPDEAKLPTPPDLIVDEPLYVQPFGIVTKLLQPQQLFSRSSYKPPDLTTLYANFRI